MFSSNQTSATVSPELQGAIVRLMTPVGKPKAADSRKAAEKVYAGQGEVLAGQFFEQIIQQGHKLSGFLVSIAALEPEGRFEFRASLQRIRDDARAKVSEAEKSGRKEAPALLMSLRSWFVRMSEAVTFSSAVDAGYVLKGNIGYHTEIGFARMFLKSKGQGSTVGAKPKTKVQKAIAYLEKLALTKREALAVSKALAV